MGAVAAIQMVSGSDLTANLREVSQLLKQAAEQGAALAVLPENFALLDSPALRALAEHEQEEQGIERFLREQARQLGIWIVAGSVPRLDAGRGEVAAPRVRSACLVLDSDGELQARYDKVHLFDVQVDDAHGAYRESDLVEAGDELVLVETPLGKLGLTICYDLRFPEQFMRLREQGAQLITVPSAFTYVTGQAHWEVLLRARAIETQCYLIGANQGGRHSASRETWGQSMVVDGNGTVLAQRAQGAGVVTAPVDLAALDELRRRMPVLAHRQQAGF
ncbi:carbon-nitrogen hydrolase family protein [Marinobacterium arenosum]|uniref:carbon-nitrogen hydrolase family protein n=1 Tax=Marinobacterium arenosum TaxID=2862496 RepID=UPI001C952132|nr:carbon-nitrogen hydrolase family protein [Marinobacterium arenosum]MBY4676753.1 carbon-nitrogen hydrolase family protein [Marinobacterium arenosum]